MPPAAPASLPLFVIAAPGLESITAAELRALGVEPTGVETGGITCEASLAQLYAMHLELRTASRVLRRVAEFHARTFVELERHVRQVPWGSLLRADATVEVTATCKKSKLYHSDAVAERVARWVAEALAAASASRVSPLETRRERRQRERDEAKARKKEGAEPEVVEELPAPPQLIHVRLLHDRCTVSLDASGELLHVRGYRQEVAKAPLRETLAAAVLLASGWDPATPLVDPLCGSGTIPIEGALMARRIAPGLRRGEAGAFAFLRWPDADAALFGQLLDEARARILPAAPAPIVGSDRDAGAVAASAANAARAGVERDIAFDRRAVSAIEAPPGRGWVVTNPPYGVRVGEREKLRDLYAALGRTVRERFPGWSLAALTADRRLEGNLADALGSELEERLRTSNGGIPVRLLVAGERVGD